MDAKKYVSVLLETVIGSILIFWVLAWIIPEEMYMDSDYGPFLQQRDYAQTSSDKQEVIFLGDSTIVDSVIPNELPDNVYNLALGGSSALEMYYTLRDYLQCHPAPKAIIVGFMPHLLEERPCYQGITLYVHYLSRKDEKEAQENIFKYDNISDKARRHDNIDRLLFDFRVPSKYGMTILKSGLLRATHNQGIFNMFREKRGHIICGDNRDGCKELNPVAVNVKSGRNKFYVLGSNAFYMKEIARLCRENHISLYYEPPVMNQASWEVLQGTEYMEDYINNMTALQQDMGVPLNVDIPVYDNKFFGDTIHLNLIGAYKYTEYLREKYAFLR